MSGIGSLHYDGTSILIAQPESGALVTEYSLAGVPRRTFGRLRATGHEGDPDVHLALNSGVPLVDPRGGFYFVFQAGEPVFQKFDRERPAAVRTAHPGSSRSTTSSRSCRRAGRGRTMSCRW